MITNYRILLKALILNVLISSPSLAEPPPVAAVGAGVIAVGTAVAALIPDLGRALKNAITLNFAGSRVWLQEVRFTQGSNDPKNAGPINGNSPVLVHIVIFYGEDAFKQLGALNADEYFRRAEQIERDYRSTIQIFKFEIPPGVDIGRGYILPDSAEGIACGVFARYGTPGAHRYNIGSDRIIEIQLGAKDFTVHTIRP
jgi:hypothetical protein